MGRPRRCGARAAPSWRGWGTRASEQLEGRGDGSIGGLTQFAGDESAPVMARRNALRALGKCRHPGAVDPIVNSLGAKDRWIHISACKAAAAFMATAGEAGQAAVEGALAAARNLETDPLLKRLR